MMHSKNAPQGSITPPIKNVGKKSSCEYKPALLPGGKLRQLKDLKDGDEVQLTDGVTGTAVSQ